MNHFEGHISDIQTSGHLSIVTVKIDANQVFKSIVIDTPETADYLKNNNRIKVLFKENEVIISLEENPPISLQNKINGTISSIEKGILLSRLEIKTNIGKLVSVISTQTVHDLSLREKLNITAMVKLNEVILAP